MAISEWRSQEEGRAETGGAQARADRSRPQLSVVRAEGATLKGDDAKIDELALVRMRATDARANGLPPVAFVIAAYNEGSSIAQTVESLPAAVCGHPARVVVVVDGASDQTAEEARRAGAVVCEVPVRRGQGAALRLGYRIAREGGARYIVTSDADGQYDPADAERVLEPVVSGVADFVSGSRVLGRDETNDPVRRFGVRVFASLLSLVTGHRVTDPAFGMRAMRVEVTASIELEQPQYQAAEVLIGVIARGFRHTERPATMRRRSASKSKKGVNLLYGLRFARVVCKTCWRERAALLWRRDS